MQKTIASHHNPIKQKLLLIKKSTKPNNSSLISKPNLSLTKASNRFSLDNTFTCTDPRQESYMKTTLNTFHHHNHSNQESNLLGSPHIFQEENSFTERLSLRPPSNSKNSYKFHAQRQSFRANSRVSHKEKLQEILQSIDLNNSIIHEIFEQDEMISGFKQEINKSFDLIDNVHSSLQMEACKRKEKLKTLGNQNENTLENKIKDVESRVLRRKIDQIRKKRSSFLKNESIFIERLGSQFTNQGSKTHR